MPRIDSPKADHFNKKKPIDLPPRSSLLAESSIIDDLALSGIPIVGTFDNFAIRKGSFQEQSAFATGEEHSSLFQGWNPQFLSSSKISIGQDSPIQINPSEFNFSQISTIQSSPSKISIGQVSAIQGGASQTSTSQVSAGQVGIRQNGSSQIDTSQIGVTQIGIYGYAYANIALLTPFQITSNSTVPQVYFPTAYHSSTSLQR